MKTSQQITGLAFALSSLLGCSRSTDIARDVGLEDGGQDESASSSDASQKDGASDGEDGESASDAAAEADAAEPPAVQCSEPTYSTAPSGAACDPARILLVNAVDSLDSCYAPALGVHCDSLVAHVGFAFEGEPCLAAGFHRAPELGPAACVLSDASGARWSGLLDEAALEAACAVTRGHENLSVYCVDDEYNPAPPT